MNSYVLLVITFCPLLKVQGDVMVRKFVYQRDMSEHCRRRVMPSVFIGRHVVEANAQILHFSQLDVPYSCSTSVRTESGGYIILVIQIEEDDINCKNGSPVKGGKRAAAGHVVVKDHRRPWTPTTHQEVVDALPAFEKGKRREGGGDLNLNLKIYEMGETFGGYWGPLPDTFLKRTPSTQEHYYTLHTATKEPVTDTEEETVIEDLTTTPTSVSTETQQPTQGTYAVEFPLVNVSARFEPSKEVNKGKPGDNIAADLDAFDQLYNVQLIPGVTYQTSIFPLVQFAVGKDQPDGRRSEDSSDVSAAGSSKVADGNKDSDDEEEKRYVFDYDIYTVDPRLRYLLTKDTGGMWPPKRYPAFANRGFIMKKKNEKKENLFEAQNMNFTKMTEELPLTNGSWAHIEALLSKLTMNDSEQIKKGKSDQQRFSALLKRINNWQHNYSAYLSPNLTHDVLSFDNPSEGLDIKDSRMNKDDVQTSSEIIPETTQSDHYYLPSISEYVRDESPTTIEPFEYSSTQTLIEVTNDLATKATNILKSTIDHITGFITEITENIRTNGTKWPDVAPTSSIKPLKLVTEIILVASITTIENTNNDTAASSSSNIITTVQDPGMLANRASWENVVQVAPKMAGILNQQLVTPKLGKKMQTLQVARRRRRRRRRRRHKKRSIHAIPVDNARPHNLTTDAVVMTTPELMYKFVDMQDFAQLVELQDDDMQGHIALRFIRNYVGTTLFDICKERGKNQSNLVYLFNTSRIVIGLSNFSLRRMTIVATPARLMSMPGQRCSPYDLECQVSGARVCVSNLTACDGVPNCGAYDIYDEDRLMCGMATGIQHNVYLAAFTFLAALLTILYTVHYWLKRCVPKVSEAFFIYTNGTENILYLESIMRSPLDVELNPNIPKQQFHNQYDEILDLIGYPSKRGNIFLRIFGCCKRKKPDYVDLEMEDLDSNIYKQSRFSFAEREICNLQKLPMYTDTSAQTGDSLQLTFVEDDFTSRSKAQKRVSIDPRHALRDIRIITDTNSLRNSQNSELQMLKFFRESKQSMEEWEDSRTSLRVMRGSGVGVQDEFELNNTVLDSLTSDSLDLPPSKIVSISPKTRSDISAAGPSSAAPKKLRFNEHLMTISQDKLQEKSAENKDDDSDHEPLPLVHEMSSSGRRRGFWTSNKSKDKDKKPMKKQQTLKK